MMLKQTKIVASISDQRCEVEFIRDLFKAGMNVVRMNTCLLYTSHLCVAVNTRMVGKTLSLYFPGLDNPFAYACTTFRMRCV